MNESEKLSQEQLQACRRRAEAALECAAERLFSPSDPLQLVFDWVPHIADGRITFQIRLERHGRKSAIDFVIDLNRLSEIEREHLNDFLARRHAGIATRYEMAWHLSWLLELSIQQTQAELTPGERQLKVRQLLLAEPHLEKQDVPTGLGISPLLICISRRGRNRLQQLHRINIKDLERESVQLYRGLEQFDKIDTEGDFRSKAEAYVQLMIVHHWKVKFVGTLLGGQVGKALAEEADLAINRLLTR